MYQPKNTKFLTFNIPYVKSNDPQFPGSNLLEISSQPQGWQSARFCTYPQELILQFQSSVTINKMQILAHEKKIPSKIEVFVGRQIGKMGFENVQFKKIGYFTFHSNEQSNWQARELKTVSIDENECHFLKLLIHKNHGNKFNPFNQVGVVTIRVFGNKADLPPPYPTKLRTAQPPKDEVAAPNNDRLIDPKILAHILALEHSKEYAISNENYQEAKKVKERITELRQFGFKIKELEDQKKIALQNEDYDLATQYKNSIQKLRAESGLTDDQGQDIRPNIDNIRNHETQIQEDITDRQHKPSIHEHIQQQSQNQNNASQIQKQADESYEQQQQQQKVLPIEVLAGLNDKTDIQNQTLLLEEKKPLNYDEIVIPALANKNKLDQNESMKEEKSKFEVEELSAEQLKQAEPIIQYFGIEFVQKFYSKSWNKREDSLKWLMEQLSNPTQIKVQNADGAFQSGLLLVYKAIQDKAAQVVYSSLMLLQSLLKHLKPTKLGEESPIILDNIVLLLMERLGDINERNKEECKKVLLNLAESQIMGTTGVINHLAKGVTTKPNLQISSTRHIQARLMLVYQLIQKYKINNEKVPYNQVMELAIKYLDHPAEQARTTAIYIITEAYKFQSEKVKESLKGVRQAQMQILDELFYKIDNGGTIMGSFDNDKQVQKAKLRKQQVQNQTNNNTDQQILTQACEFCGDDKDLLNSFKLDMHLWKECVMLTICQSCAQVVEVQTFNAHCLEECEFAKEYRQCEICGTSIKENQLEQHLKLKTCNTTSQETCPLCFQQIGLNWKVHLATCQKQDRNKKKID